jgi:hypothetical protein
MTSLRRTSAAAWIAVAAIAACAPAQADAVVAVSPPTVVAFLGQSIAAPGADVALGFTVSNPNGATILDGVHFSVALPAGLRVSTPSQVFTTCDDATATATDGGSSMSVTGATLQASGDEGDSCVAVVNVVATGTGATSVASGAPGSTESADGVPSNTVNLQVLTSPTIAESFATPSIKVGDKTTVTYTIHNPNAAALEDLALNDALPAGLAVAAPPNVTTCGAGNVTAAAGAATIALDGLELLGSAQCSFSVDVSGTGATSSANPTGALAYQYDGGTGDLFSGSAPGASATLTVVGPPVLTAAFSPATVAPGATAELAFTIANPNATRALSGIGFSDTLPAGLLVAPTPGLTGSCGAGTITAAGGSGSIALAAGTLAAGGTCTFSVDVSAGSLGLKANTTSTVTSVEGGIGAAATASLLVATPTVLPGGIIPPPPPPPPPAPRLPSNSFKTAKLRADASGTVRFDISVPGAGTVGVLETLGGSSTRAAKSKKSSAKTVARKVVKTRKAGKVHVTVRLFKSGRKALKHAGRAPKLHVAISFRPTGGKTRTVHKTVVVHRH